MTAIEQAIEEVQISGGYDVLFVAHDGIGRPILRRKNSEFLLHDSMLLDPLFWQALGKARGETREVMSSSWTIWPPTKVPPPRRLSWPGARGYCSCRPTVPISTQSRWRSQNSRPSYAEAVRTIDALWQAIGHICDLFD